MDPNDIKKLRKLTSFEALVDYLRDDLDWPIEAEDAEKVAFEYDPKELRIDPLHAVKIESIKQIRPLSDKQPWGVFYIQFENKNLPVVLLRRILHALVPASRKRDPDRKAWKMSDLLFISSQGAENDRSISFAHFQEVDGRPQLRTFAWDVKETHLYYIKNLNLNALRWPADARDADAWRRQWSEAFTVAYRYVPTTAEMLAKKMAQIASYIREAVELTYSMEHAGGPLHQLHLSLKMDLISDLSEDDFSDMYAQTVTYGLFAARATRSGSFGSGDFAKRPGEGSRSGTAEVVTTAKAMIEHTNPFLRELLEQMMDQQSLDLDELGVTELTDLLGKVNMEAILQDFGRQKRGEDPVIHFYETFMRAYDPQQKTKRGEFYTPDPAVSFIVRSVDYLLRTEFGCEDGVATPINPSPKFRPLEFGGGQEGAFSPVFLDPATGTGTFLRYIIMVAWDTFYQKYKKLSNAQRKEKWNQYVRQSLLPRLYAFELKMSPYTIAHMKVGLTLQEYGFEFQEGERLRIYLTNALQPAHEVARVDTPALAHESEQANEVKNKAPITVVIGNPPYSKFSANNGQWISDLLRSYYQVDGKPLGEKNPKWLQDDYVKFIRFGQWRINESGYGILAMITNHGYLNNPTFRGMRQQLLQSFSKIYILDLHGSSKKQEKSPDGSKEENVFDIQQGVAICLMIKSQTTSTTTDVYHSDIFGSRKSKYEILLLEDVSNIKWNKLKPESPSYLFIPQDTLLLPEYNEGWLVSKIFPIFASTVTTARNDFSMAYSPDVLDERIKDLQNLSIPDKTIREKYSLKDVSYWTLAKARRELSTITDRKKYIKTYCYRPFDFRFVYYHKAVCERLRAEVMSHMQNENIAFLTHRPQSPSDFTFAYCTRVIGDQNVAANKSAGGGNSFQFPL